MSEGRRRAAVLAASVCLGSSLAGMAITGTVVASRAYDQRQQSLLPPGWGTVGQSGGPDYVEYGRFVPEPGVVCYTARASTTRASISCVVLPEEMAK